MNKLTKIRRYRFSEQMVQVLKSLPFESKFVRDAISEKIEKNYPKIIAEEKRKQELIICPF